MKAYIYCTAPKDSFKVEHQIFYKDELTRDPDTNQFVFGTSLYLMCAENKYTKDNFLNRKIVASFDLNNVDFLEVEFYKGNDSYQEICKLIPDDDELMQDWNKSYITSNSEVNPESCKLLRELCLSFEDIKNYLGVKADHAYAWHIDNLKIFDKPMELSEFCTFTEQKGMIPLIKGQMTRAPQSWCYGLDEEQEKCIIISVNPMHLYNILVKLKTKELRKNIPAFLKP